MNRISMSCLVILAFCLQGLNPGSVHAKHDEDVFGPELPVIRDLGLDGAMDATVVGETLYVIGRGRLHVANIADPAAPRIVGSLDGLGNTRQIEVHRNVAYVTAREDGLFIIDVRKPAEPTLLCHYDSIELATGVALSGDVAFIACRTAGVELVDISDPTRPVHLSTVRTGEAQSVDVCNGILYAGVWGSRELVICDVSNPYRPTIIAKAPLDGYGDGLTVRGDYCFVATGHHSRQWNRKDGEDSPHFGAGHGLEIFDISQPEQPVFVSRIKLPRFYRIGMDMWDVMVTGDYAFVGDTYNGVFVVDISDLQKPHFVGHRQLEQRPRTIDGLDTGEQLPGPVGGIALAGDTLYVAGAWTDLHVVSVPGIAQTPEPKPDEGPSIPAERSEDVDSQLRTYRPAGQVWAVAFVDDIALVAAGAAGLHAVQLWPEFKRLSVFPTDGFARDVTVADDTVYVAEAGGGLSIWRRDEEAILRGIGRYKPRRGGVAQAVVPPPGQYALLHVGQNELQVVDVRNPQSPELMLSEKHLGLFYTFPLVQDLLEDRFACCLWHASGYRWYDLYGGSKPVYSGDHLEMRASFVDGMAVVDDKALLVYRGKYSLLNRDERRPPQDLPAHGVAGTYLTGKPTIDGTTMYLSNRVRGTIQAVDISQVDQPRLLSTLQLDEHPGLVVLHNDHIVIPAGYQGLVIWDGRDPQ